MTASNTHAHEVKAKDSEREAIARQLQEFLSAGGIPEIVTTCRPEKVSISQAERNAMTFENSRHER